jgi:hypothetical protein
MINHVAIVILIVSSVLVYMNALYANLILHYKMELVNAMMDYMSSLFLVWIVIQVVNIVRSTSAMNVKLHY